MHSSHAGGLKLRATVCCRREVVALVARSGPQRAGGAASDEGGSHLSPARRPQRPGSPTVRGATEARAFWSTFKECAAMLPRRELLVRRGVREVDVREAARQMGCRNAP